MSYPMKVVLALPLSAPDVLGPFVERCLSDGVELICVAGPGADEIEDEIDWLVVGDGSDRDRFLVTTAHSEETFDEVLRFAKAWMGDKDAAEEAAQLVRL